MFLIYGRDDCDVKVTENVPNGFSVGALRRKLGNICYSARLGYEREIPYYDQKES